MATHQYLFVDFPNVLLIPILFVLWLLPHNTLSFTSTFLSLLSSLILSHPVIKRHPLKLGWRPLSLLLTPYNPWHWQPYPGLWCSTYPQVTSTQMHIICVYTDHSKSITDECRKGSSNSTCQTLDSPSPRLSISENGPTIHPVMKC